MFYLLGDLIFCHIRRSIGASDVAKNGVSFVSSKSRVDEFFGRGWCTDERVNKTISYEVNRPMPLTLQLFHPCFHSQTSQVKFYCDIRLAFVKKDHQLVYRYNTENNKLKLRK